MPPLHITKVAVGCSSLEVLAERIASRAVNAVADVQTRYRPKQADELIGGSLFWIIKHRLVARQTIIGFEETEGGKKCRIKVAANLIPVAGYPRRAHQGWRYLKGADAPPDLGGGDVDVAALPPGLANELSALALL
jgi:hypothetical protein